ncbi:MAG: UDP-N-acetylmuramate--L-alanine ligase [Thermodesulfobacteriota bacterium]
MYRRVKKLHFVGIGGIGMSGIAEVLLNLGYKVSGSDLKETGVTRRLAQLGAQVYYGHHSDNLGQAQAVVYSTAVKPDNPELVAARERLIPVVSRGEMLAELMRMKFGIAVAGSHGKTTTTSLITSILAYGGLDPTAVIGGRVKALASNAKLGQSEYLVCEADESDGSFLRLSPRIVVVTNVNAEHLDHYKDMSRLQATFRQFLDLIPFYGLAALCWDNPGVREIAKGYSRRYTTYGLSGDARLRAENVQPDGFQVNFLALLDGRELGRIRLPLPGLHNVLNCLAALAVALELEIPFPIVSEAMERFAGVERRFQVKGKRDGITIVDDYGHHPEEIKATLSAARSCHSGRLVVLFQPHRFSRLQALFPEFLDAFKEADLLMITDVYPAGEQPIAEVNSAKLYGEIKKKGHPEVSYHPNNAELLEAAWRVLRPQDMVMTLGAGDIGRVADQLAGRLGAR